MVFYRIRSLIACLSFPRLSLSHRLTLSNTCKTYVSCFTVSCCFVINCFVLVIHAYATWMHYNSHLLDLQHTSHVIFLYIPVFIGFELVDVINILVCMSKFLIDTIIMLFIALTLPSTHKFNALPIITDSFILISMLYIITPLNVT